MSTWSRSVAWYWLISILLVHRGERVHFDAERNYTRHALRKNCSLYVIATVITEKGISLISKCQNEHNALTSTWPQCISHKHTILLKITQISCNLVELTSKENCHLFHWSQSTTILGIQCAQKHTTQVVAYTYYCGHNVHLVSTESQYHKKRCIMWKINILDKWPQSSTWISYSKLLNQLCNSLTSYHCIQGASWQEGIVGVEPVLYLD